MSDDPRYPIGRYQPPAAWDPAQAEAWRVAIGALPVELEAAADGLSDTQLDTPYREGGWTVRQLVHHVADSHMNAYVRFKLALTEDTPVIKPYDEAKWAALPDAALPLDISWAILWGVHARWETLLAAMGPEEYARGWFHPEHQAESPLWKALGLYAWHGRHHTAHITALRARMGW